MLRALLVTLFVLPSLPAADLEVLLPANGDQIVYVNVKRLATSSLFKTMLKPEIEGKLKSTDVPKWLKEAGIDPWKDIETISMTMVAPKPRDRKAEKEKAEKAAKEGKPPEPMEKREQEMAFVVVRGVFDGEKIFAIAEQAVQKAGDIFSIVKEDGVKMVKAKSPDGNEFYATLADEKTLIAASKPKLLHDALKAHDEKVTKSQVSKELSDLIAALDNNAAFYQANTIDGPLIASSIQENPLFEDLDLLKKQVSEMQSYSVVVRVGRDVGFELAMGMKSKEAATAFGETGTVMIDKAKTLIALAGAAKAEFGGVINDFKKTTKVTVAGDIVKLSGKVTGDAIGKVVGFEE